VLSEVGRFGSGASKNVPHYLRGESTAEILTKSILAGLRSPMSEWEANTVLVDEVVRDARNHADACPCDLCLEIPGHVGVEFGSE
jgi:hypothetical protein